MENAELENAEQVARLAALGQIRRAMQYFSRTAKITDEEAMAINTVFPRWEVGVAYAVGTIVNYNNNLYRCAQAHTSQSDWTPDTSPSLWSPISFAEDGKEIWTQPTGSHDAYPAGFELWHKGKEWVSDVDNNVWEPGVFGWSLKAA